MICRRSSVAKGITVQTESLEFARPVQSSILDGNSFSARDLDRLDPTSRELVRRRAASLGPSYRLFYGDPVHPVRSQGCYLYGAGGEVFLDAYNNVASVGHANPEVIAAVHEQMSTLNTHTRYLQNGIVDFAEQFLATFPDHIDTVMFTNSGSEANDLALRVARLWTGGRGVVVTAEAYHGTTDLLATVSPSVTGTFGTDPAVRVVPEPSEALAAAAGQSISDWFAAQVDAAFTDMREHGIVPAAFLADSIFSSDGIFPNEAGFLAKTIDVVHAHGALFISDEVQPGFTRTGETFWGFERHGGEADLVTCGKPMGNGMPVAALAGRADVMGRFGRDVPYFNTFGGSSVPIAAARAVLTFIQRENLIDSVRDTGAALKAGIIDIAAGTSFVKDVRGVGLYVGVEVVDEAGLPDSTTALRVVNELRRRRVLISVAGHNNNVLKIRPPLVFGEAEVATFLDRFDQTVQSLRPTPLSGASV